MERGQHLKPYHWQKGQSGNPNGYSRGRRQIDDLMKLIETTEGAERAISEMWLKSMLSGNFNFLKEYLERRDGKVPTPVEVEAKPAIDWSAIDVECDTPPRNHAIDTQGLHPLSEGGETGI